MGNINLNLNGAYVEITSKCNLNCPYCYNDSGSKHYELNCDDVFRIVDELYSKNIFAIAISGGEPFLHSDIKKIIDYCIKKGVRPNIITNLTMLDEKQTIDLLNKNVSFQVTFDGYNEETHSFTRGKNIFKKNIDFIENALLLNKIDNVSIRFNIHKLNYNYLDNFVDLMSKYNIKNISFSFVKKIGRGKSWNYVFDDKRDILLINLVIYKLKELFKKYPEMTLTYGKPEESLGCVFYSDGCVDCVPRVDCNGKVYLCQLFDGNSNILGDINHSSLQEIIVNNQTIEKLNAIRNRKINRNNDCLNCPFSDYCLGGCPAIIFQNNSEFESNDGQCHMIKYFMKNKLIHEVKNN